MCRKDYIFFSIIFLWFIVIICEVIIFPTFAKQYGLFLNVVPLTILFIIIMPRIFSSRYNNWLESGIEKHELTIKEIRLKKLKRIK